jgi:hypothetical protein
MIGLWLRYLSGRLSLEQIFKGHNEPLFNATPGFCQCPKNWDEITEETFKTVFKTLLKEQNFKGLNQKH